VPVVNCHCCAEMEISDFVYDPADDGFVGGSEPECSTPSLPPRPPLSLPPLFFSRTEEKSRRVNSCAISCTCLVRCHTLYCLIRPGPPFSLPPQPSPHKPTQTKQQNNMHAHAHIFFPPHAVGLASIAGGCIRDRVAPRILKSAVQMATLAYVSATNAAWTAQEELNIWNRTEVRLRTARCDNTCLNG